MDNRACRSQELGAAVPIILLQVAKYELFLFSETAGWSPYPLPLTFFWSSEIKLDAKEGSGWKVDGTKDGVRSQTIYFVEKLDLREKKYTMYSDEKIEEIMSTRKK